ncbi:MAG: flagellar hook-length control protein FliK [Burkholderiales bacterium]
MNPESLSRLRLLVDTAAPTALIENRDRLIPPLQPGQALDARVEKQTARGHLVSIRGRQIEFKLPEGVREGDILRLVYVDDQPRPAYSLTRIDRAPAEPNSQLSNAGRLLSSLFEGESETSAAHQARSPLFAGPPPPTAHAAAILQSALHLSGLFYESHQAQWVAGKRSTAQILAEPQGRLAPLARSHPDPSDPAGLSNEAAAVGQSIAAGEEAGRVAVRPESFPILRDQLALLESGQMIWRGEAWPGQGMQWSIAEEANNAAPASGRVWQTRIRLTLPALGVVDARIRLSGTGASLHIEGDTANHASLLREHMPALASGLAAAGVSVNALTVEHEIAAT